MEATSYKINFMQARRELAVDGKCLAHRRPVRAWAGRTAGHSARKRRARVRKMEPRVAEADKFWGRKTVSFSFAKMHCGPVLVTGKQACCGGGRIFCEWCPETVTLLYQNAVLVWDRNTGPCSGPREGACPNLKWHGSNSSTYTSIPC